MPRRTRGPCLFLLTGGTATEAAVSTLLLLLPHEIDSARKCTARASGTWRKAAIGLIVREKFGGRIWGDGVEEMMTMTEMIKPPPLQLNLSFLRNDYFTHAQGFTFALPC